MPGSTSRAIGKVAPFASSCRQATFTRARQWVSSRRLSSVALVMPGSTSRAIGKVAPFASSRGFSIRRPAETACQRSRQDDPLTREGICHRSGWQLVGYHLNQGSRPRSSILPCLLPEVVDGRVRRLGPRARARDRPQAPHPPRHLSHRGGRGVGARIAREPARLRDLAFAPEFAGRSRRANSSRRPSCTMGVEPHRRRATVATRRGNTPCASPPP